MVDWFYTLSKHIDLIGLQCMNYISGYISLSMTDVRVSSVLYCMGSALESNITDSSAKNSETSFKSTKRSEVESSLMIEEICEITGNIIHDNFDSTEEIFQTGIIKTIGS